MTARGGCCKFFLLPVAQSRLCQDREALTQQNLAASWRHRAGCEFKSTAQAYHKANAEQKVNSTDKQLSVALDRASGSHFAVPFCQMLSLLTHPAKAEMKYKTRKLQALLAAQGGNMRDTETSGSVLDVPRRHNWEVGAGRLDKPVLPHMLRLLSLRD